MFNMIDSVVKLLRQSRVERERGEWGKLKVEGKRKEREKSTVVLRMIMLSMLPNERWR